MKSYKKSVLISLMRAISLAFVLIMSLGFINIMSCQDTNDEGPLSVAEMDFQYKSTYTDLLFNLYERTFMFYPFVFVLGAFWSRKKMIKSGII